MSSSQLKKSGTGLDSNIYASSTRSATSEMISEIFAVNVPKTVRIDAPAFGIALRVVQCAIVGGILYNFVTTEAYAKSIPATGTLISAWMDGGTMAHNLDATSKQAYCATPYSFDYKYCDKTTATKSFNEFWCEDNIECRAVDPTAAMYKQSTYDMWAISYVKDKKARAVPCAQGASACDASKNEVFQILHSPDSCQCVHTKNYFIPGVEDLQFGFQPKLTLGNLQCRLYHGGLVNTSLYVRKINAPAAGACGSDAQNEATWNHVQDYGRGKTIFFSGGQLLEWAGFPDGLDSPDTSVSDEYTESTGNPSMRITGITFQVRILFNGSIDSYDSEGGPAASIEVEPILGWHSIGDDMPLNTATMGSEAGSGALAASGSEHVPYGVEHVNKYRRGVHLDISFGGEVRMFDPAVFISQIASVFVYIGLASVFAQILILNLLGYTSKVYRGLTKELVSVESVHEQKSAEALIAASTYLTVQRLKDEKLKSDEEEAARAEKDPDKAQRMAVRSAFITSGLAEAEAAVLMQNVTGTGSVGSLTYDAFANASSGTARNITIEDVAQNSRKIATSKRGKDGAKKVMPAPEIRPTM